MSAGSNTVVASLWKVDDRATANLMAEFYRAMLQEGIAYGRSTALHKTQNAEGVRKFQPRVGFWQVEHSTLKAFANSFGVDSVRFIDTQG